MPQRPFRFFNDVKEGPLQGVIHGFEKLRKEQAAQAYLISAPLS